MSSSNNGSIPALPEDLRNALETGELTLDQLKELIRLEAQALGLTYRDAVRRARKRNLPRSAVADDLDLLVQMLPA